MRRPVRPRSILLAASILLTMPAAAAPLETPEDFGRRVYARYRNDGPAVSMDRPGGAAFYTAALLDAFAKDTASPGGAGVTGEWDPICDCHAFLNLRITRVTTGERHADSVKVQVAFINLRFPHTVTLTLARTLAGWRIADVGDKGGENDVASVLALLRKANAKP